jgi:hypothetical protein
VEAFPTAKCTGATQDATIFKTYKTTFARESNERKQNVTGLPLTEKLDDDGEQPRRHREREEISAAFISLISTVILQYLWKVSAVNATIN